MRTTLNIDETMLKQASRLTGVEEKTSLVHLGLQALIARASAQRLAELGGSDARLKPVRRRRSLRRSQGQ
jgi:Arc/MetJ family transcription regulator